MTVVLRDYQNEALIRWFRNNRKGIIELPTGTGKTYLGLKLLELYYHKNGKICIVVPTEVLLKQWYQKIIKNTDIRSHDIGFLYGKEKRLKRVVIGIINTIVKYSDLLAKNYDLFILDEIHHYFSPKWNIFLEKIREKDIIGLSATVERSDNLHLNSYLRIIYRKDYNYMMKRNYVSRVEVKIIKTDLTTIEYRVYRDLDEKIREISKKLDDLRYSISSREYPYYENKYRRLLMILANKRRQLTSESVTKLPVIAQIIKEHENERIIVFTESKRTVEQLYKYLRQFGFKCGIVHSGIKRRHAILEAWKRGIFNILLTVRVLDEGIDVPDCSVGIIVSNSLTKRQLVQRIGRVVRPKENKIAKIYIVISSGTFEERVARKLKYLLTTSMYYYT